MKWILSCLLYQIGQINPLSLMRYLSHCFVVDFKVLGWAVGLWSCAVEIIISLSALTTDKHNIRSDYDEPNLSAYKFKRSYVVNWRVANFFQLNRLLVITKLVPTVQDFFTTITSRYRHYYSINFLCEIILCEIYFAIECFHSIYPKMLHFYFHFHHDEILIMQLLCYWFDSL